MVIRKKNWLNTARSGKTNRWGGTSAGSPTGCPGHGIGEGRWEECPKYGRGKELCRSSQNGCWCLQITKGMNKWQTSTSKQSMYLLLIQGAGSDPPSSKSPEQMTSQPHSCPWVFSHANLLLPRPEMCCKCCSFCPDPLPPYSQQTLLPSDNKLAWPADPSVWPQIERPPPQIPKISTLPTSARVSIVVLYLFLSQHVLATCLISMIWVLYPWSRTESEQGTQSLIWCHLSDLWPCHSRKDKA